MKVLNSALKAGALGENRQQKSNAVLKASEQALSARMTKSERDRVARISFDLAQKGISHERGELDALARGATVIFNDVGYWSYDNDSYCDCNNSLKLWCDH